MAAPPSDTPATPPSPDLLPTLADNYRGVLIDGDALTEFSGESFGSALKAMLPVWKERGNRGVWLRLTMPAHAKFLEPAISLGFEFNNVSGKVTMLATWLPDCASRLPNGPLAYLGVGGVVINDKNEILVIIEKSNHAGKMHYKLPGGLVDPGESLQQAAIREVFEETGIQTQFESIVCFRTRSDYTFGFSDIYFVCRLSVLPTAAATVTAQEEEIAHCTWLPFETYLADEKVSSLHKSIARVALASREQQGHSGELSSTPIPTELQGNKFYFPVRADTHHLLHPTGLSWDPPTVAYAQLNG